MTQQSYTCLSTCSHQLSAVLSVYWLAHNCSLQILQVECAVLQQHTSAYLRVCRAVTAQLVPG